MALLGDGQKINGTYEVERFIGEGAFAEVYRVRHRFLGRQAMKVFKNQGLSIEETEQLLGEAILLSRIGHPHIVRVFDANTVECNQGHFGYFTMEYIAGGSLDQFWRSHGNQLVPVAMSVELLSQVCMGLTIAHTQDPPIIHRDIKPQNILVGYNDKGEIHAKVSDFGLAKQVNPLTLMASARGTLMFKAPETIRDFNKDSRSGDVWALGMTLYMLLTDQLPYANRDIDLPSTSDFVKLPVAPSQFNITVDPLLDRITLRSLTYNPSERYPSAKELLADLQYWQSHQASYKKRNLKPVAQETNKATWGIAGAPMSEQTALQMAEQALAIAHQASRLNEAADLMEEAFNQWPGLRKQYEYHISLWRRGIVS